MNCCFLNRKNNLTIKQFQLQVVSVMYEFSFPNLFIGHLVQTSILTTLES